MIPKVFHQVWLGPRPLHPLMAKWRQAFRDLHPDWELCAWTSPDGLSPLTCEQVPSGFESSYPDLLTRACHYSQRSNILRYELVHAYGGVYLDTDIEPLRPVTNTVVHLEAFASPYSHVPDKLGCAVFGARARHPWLGRLVGELPGADPAVSLSMGSDFMTRVTRDYVQEPGAEPPEILRPETFYHFLNPWICPDGMLSDHARSKLGTETLAVHQWSSKWYGHGFEPLKTKEHP